MHLLNPSWKGVPHVLLTHSEPDNSFANFNFNPNLRGDCPDILFVDDNLDSRDLVRFMLQQDGNDGHVLKAGERRWL